MCNLTKQAFAKALLTLKLSACVCEIHCSTIKQILQNKCMGIRFVSTNRSRSYNSTFMRLLMNDGDFKPLNVGDGKALCGGDSAVGWHGRAGSGQRRCIHSVQKKHRITNVMCDNLYSTLNTYKGN